MLTFEPSATWALNLTVADCPAARSPAHVTLEEFCIVQAPEVAAQLPGNREIRRYGRNSPAATGAYTGVLIWTVKPTRLPGPRHSKGLSSVNVAVITLTINVTSVKTPR
ncbi:MAG: hypothetical protein IPL01_10075 [Acidobacteria bacterium]|nr:hypothetical protein [Acidobacteriota bacterium]